MFGFAIKTFNHGSLNHGMKQKKEWKEIRIISFRQAILNSIESLKVILKNLLSKNINSYCSEI